MQLKVIIKSSEDGGVIASVPALRGCWSQGATRAEAVANIRKAIEAWLETEQDKAEATADARSIELVNV